jgi:hypothetical protein
MSLDPHSLTLCGSQFCAMLLHIAMVFGHNFCVDLDFFASFFIKQIKSHPISG